MKSAIDLHYWNRKEHFEFFNGFDEPFFGIVSEIGCGKALSWCRKNKVSFFHFYLYQSLRAANKVEEFRHRIEDSHPVCYNVIHASPTIGRPDKTFGFSFIPYTENFKEFVSSVIAETEAVAACPGLRLNDNTCRNDVIHFSVIPWINFTGLSHARHFAIGDSVPKITFGKYYETAGEIKIPVSVNAHHGLMDAWHVSLFLNLLESFLGCPES
ncbi:MAG: chloramphenicol acetyltransferase [Bacteroidota bacterium]